jgi:VanZ family protein
VQIKPVFSGADKIVHACLYAGLAAIVSVGMRRSGRKYSLPVQLLVPIVFVALYGVFDEFHQSFVPGRSCDILDATADVFGAAAVQAFLCFRVWKLHNKDAVALK